MKNKRGIFNILMGVILFCLSFSSLSKYYRFSVASNKDTQPSIEIEKKHQYISTKKKRVFVTYETGLIKTTRT